MKNIYLLAIILALSVNLKSQIHWTKHSDNPVMVPGASGEWDESFIAAQSIIFFDSTYHMWYWGGDLYNTESIGHATSRDGISWTKDTNNPVLAVGPEGSWDDTYIHGCSVILVDSIFHMWYTGHTGLNPNTNYAIGHATSPDGVTWAKDTNNPVMDVEPSGVGNEMWVVVGSAIHVSN